MIYLPLFPFLYSFQTAKIKCKGIVYGKIISVQDNHTEGQYT